ncbi:MAG: methyltransferase domain-containing protein [Gemmatimonadales bacterium]|jgi:magnesium-protoporphyrin O-methyltransferase
MSCCHCQGAQRVFAGRYVARNLKRYRRKGPDRTTRMLIDALAGESVEGATLLDIGGGVGVIEYELLNAGADRAMNVEAARGYIEAARDEAGRRGLADRVTIREGDFVEIADDVESADIVTLDRVICCYPDWEALVTRSLAKSRKIYGVVYPRSVWWTSIGHRLLNFSLWLTRNPFRVYAHPTVSVDAAIRKAGFVRLHYSTTMNWQIVVYRRGAGAE